MVQLVVCVCFFVRKMHPGNLTPQHPQQKSPLQFLQTFNHDQTGKPSELPSRLPPIPSLPQIACSAEPRIRDGPGIFPNLGRFPADLTWASTHKNLVGDFNPSEKY